MSDREKDLARLKANYGLEADDDLDAFMAAIVDFYRKELSDIEGLSLSCEPSDKDPKLMVLAKLSINGREYAMAQLVSPTHTNYAPAFRVWVAEVSESAARRGETAPIG